MLFGENYLKWDNQFIGWLVSEKLDGMRAIFNPSTREIYSRYGNLIVSPDWWTKDLPSLVLDGELWLGRKGFQRLRSIVSRKRALRFEDWKEIRFKVFDVLGREWGGIEFKGKLDLLGSLKGEFFEGIEFSKLEGEENFYSLLKTVHFRGGEGLMIRDPLSISLPSRRTGELLKVKILREGTGKVVGYNLGEGKFLGLLGSLLVVAISPEDISPEPFSISGFTDLERKDYRSLYPIGSLVDFVFRDLSDTKVPKEARKRGS